MRLTRKRRKRPHGPKGSAATKMPRRRAQARLDKLLEGVNAELAAEIRLAFARGNHIGEVGRIDYAMRNHARAYRDALVTLSESVISSRDGSLRDISS